MAKNKDKPFRPFRKQRLPPHRYECLFCESQFRWNRDLEAHMNSHTNERPNFCDKCSASYPNASYLGVHKRIKHDKKIYKCDFCGLIFKNLGNLCSHRRIKHNVKPERGERKVVTPKSCIISPNHKNSSSLNRPKSKTFKPPKDVPRRPRGRPPKKQISDPVPQQIKIELELNDDEKEEESPPPQQPSTDQNVTSPPCFKRRLIKRCERIDYREDVDVNVKVNEQDGYYGYEVPAAPPITIPPGIPPHLVPFYAVLEIAAVRNRSKNSEWDSSFFLHMNRYDPNQDMNTDIKKEPEKNNKSREHSKTNRRPRQSSGAKVKREILKSNQVYGSFGSIKRGRPRKDSEDQDVVVKVEAKDMIDVRDWEILDGGQKAKCPYCERVMFRANVHSHVLVHTGEKPFKCKFCEKSFRQKSHLIKHIIRYHRYGHEIGKPGVRKTPALLMEAEKNLDCAFCGKKFNDKWNLEQHLLKVHNDEYR